MNSGSTTGTSYGLYANTSTFCIRNSNIFILSQSSMLDPIRKYLFVSGNILTLISSSAQLALCSPRGFCNCYNGASSTISLCLACSAFQRTTTTRHCTHNSDALFGLKFDLYMQSGWDSPHCVNPGPFQNRCV